ncbi:hypothetical protein C3408_22365 [Candidatus Pantoea alvi]|uniref:hypothetical protein n=1 Tax=Pantoea septica TaxID=472695 RepID=UPI000CDD1A88|nr:hypothetical protein [Pantoea septica]POW54602.1 hypothetical protein C3408_22365 [Pantoea alvi]
MKLINRKEFDRRVTSGELNEVQAVWAEEGFCLIAGIRETNEAFMLMRTDKSPYIWNTAKGPVDYASTRGKRQITIHIRTEKSINLLLSEGLKRG